MAAVIDRRVNTIAKRTKREDVDISPIFRDAIPTESAVALEEDFDWEHIPPIKVNSGNARGSVRKLGDIGRMIRHMSIDEALAQLEFCRKRSAYRVRLALEEATREYRLRRVAFERDAKFLEFWEKAPRHEWDPVRRLKAALLLRRNLFVAVSFSGKGKRYRAVHMKARGKNGVLKYQLSHLKIYLEERAKIPSMYRLRREIDQEGLSPVTSRAISQLAVVLEPRMHEVLKKLNSESPLASDKKNLLRIEHELLSDYMQAAKDFIGTTENVDSLKTRWSIARMWAGWVIHEHRLQERLLKVKPSDSEKKSFYCAL